MSVTLTAEYKGYVIEHNGRGFTILLEGAVQTRSPKTPEACVEWIDKKAKQAFTRTPVIVFGDLFYGEMRVKEATATSYTDDAVWVTYTETGKREMVKQQIVYSDTFENRELLEKILAEGKVISDATARKYKLSKELEVFDVSVMTLQEAGA